MPKVYGLHTIELHPGVKAEDFEKFITEEVYPIYKKVEGWEIHLLKGDRGNRTGKYMIMFEIDSVEARARYMPSANEASEEGRKLRESPEVVAALEKWATLATRPGNFTDYVVVGR